MNAKQGIFAVLSLSIAVFFSNPTCRAAALEGVEASPADAVGALNVPISAAETLGAASMDLSDLSSINLEVKTQPALTEEGLTAATEIPSVAAAPAPASLQTQNPMKAAKTLFGRLTAFVKNGTKDAAKDKGLAGQVAQGRAMFDLAGNGVNMPAISVNAEATQPTLGIPDVSLQAPAPTPSGGVANAVPSNSLKTLVGSWRAVSGYGPKLLKLRVEGDAVTVRWPTMGYNSGYSFFNINGPTIADKPWRGSWAAPGGLIRGETTTTFRDGKLEMRHVQTETHVINLPEKVITTKSFEIRGDQLIQINETALYRRLFFYFGPYSVRTTFNTTNLADSNFGKSITVYERITAEKKP